MTLKTYVVMLNDKLYIPQGSWANKHFDTANMVCYQILDKRQRNFIKLARGLMNHIKLLFLIFHMWLVTTRVDGDTKMIIAKQLA